MKEKISSKKRNQPSKEKKTYKTPSLVTYGKLIELTEGGKGTVWEGTKSNSSTKHP
jgi:hypothetical protein